MSENQHRDFIVQQGDASLTPTELAGERRLREAYMLMSRKNPRPDLISLTMSKVAVAPTPSKAIHIALKHMTAIGATIFTVGLVAVFVAFSGANTISCSFSVPVLDGAHSLWSFCVLIVIGIGIWRMETV